MLLVWDAMGYNAGIRYDKHTGQLIGFAEDFQFGLCVQRFANKVNVLSVISPQEDIRIDFPVCHHHVNTLTRCDTHVCVCLKQHYFQCSNIWNSTETVLFRIFEYSKQYCFEYSNIRCVLTLCVHTAHRSTIKSWTVYTICISCRECASSAWSVMEHQNTRNFSA